MFEFLKKKNKKNFENEQDSEIKNQRPMTEFEKSIINAENGNIPEATHVGISYHYGIDKGDEEHPYGIEPNFDLAIKYLTMAAQKGYLKAQVDLGMLYFSKIDKAKGFEWLSLAAKRGDAFSQFVLACSYRDGTFVEKNLDKAYQWYLESAYNGEVGSMSMLGGIYRERAIDILNQEDFEEHKDESWMNAELSFKWYKLAADNGDEESMYFTGVNYCAGFGVAEDKEKSLIYINLAIENGIDYANDFKQEHLM